MTAVPVYCTHCGALFPSQWLNFGSNSFIREIQLSENEETCIRCGQQATVVDGTFALTRGVLELISGPAITVDILEAFDELVGRAARHEINEDELQEAAADIDPKLGAAVAYARASKYGLAALILAGLVLHACDFKLNVEVDVNRLWDQMNNPTTANEVVVQRSKGGHQAKEEDARGHSDPSSNSPKKEAASKSHSALPSDKKILSRKPKARDIRRKTARARRKQERLARRSWRKAQSPGGEN